MSNEPIKTAEDILYQYSNVKGGAKGHYEDETQIIFAMEQYASQQTAELQREVERLREALRYILEESGSRAECERIAEQALKDKP